jgi:rare lipoprotein A
LVVVSLAALRNNETPDEAVSLTAGARIDFSTRLSPSRASRGKSRVLLAPATTTSTTEAPPPTTAKPRPVVKKTPPTTAAPKAKAQSAPSPSPKPAAQPSSSSSTPTTVSSRPMPTGGSTADGSQEGMASWYEAKYHASNPWICAHRTLPMGTVLTVTSLSSGKSITCEVGDRGPYADGRILDLSKYAFSQLANPSSGVISVKIQW